MHIGLIGGIGPAATEFYYRGLTNRHAKSGTRLQLLAKRGEQLTHIIVERYLPGLGD